MALLETALQSRPTEPVSSRWRKIVTSIPAPQSLPIIEKLRSVEPRSMTGMPPILWHEAEGFLVRDPYGNQWIDLTSGIIVANAGHSHPRIRKAIVDAADKKLLATYAFPSQSRLDLLQKLTKLAPMPDAKAILYSAGTEATECAIMLMRQHGQKISPDKTAILSFGDSYHGRTLSAALASGSPTADDWIERKQVKHYQMPYPFCVRCPWGREGYESCGRECFTKCLEQLEKQGVCGDQIAGIIAEPVAGWATWPIPPDFAKAMADWAKQHDIVLCLDEVQAGCGRTGRLFACEHLDVTPDLICLGKGLTSSLPVSAVIGRAALMDLPEPGHMSSTHGGNPLCAAAALANLEVIEDEKLVEASEKTGKLVLDHLQPLKKDLPTRVRSVHGRGLFISIHFQQGDTGEPAIALADAVVHEAVRRGVLMFTTSRGFLKFTPPLCIDPDAAIEAADVIRECVMQLKDQY